MTLSKKRIFVVDFKNVRCCCYEEEAVKEFIKRLKEKISPTVAGPWVNEQIDKLAGDKLI